MSSKWNVIFLVDQIPVKRILMLKRADHKSFAPGFYTGVGGKVENDETILESAYRELQEETGITDVELIEFARCYIEEDYGLHYFWGLLVDKRIPVSDDGSLEWTQTQYVGRKKIIPTTKEVLTQWEKRNFSIETPFTLYVDEIGNANGVRLVQTSKVEDSLQ